jgi:hypothetical protein
MRHTSVPRDQAIELDPAGARHLVVAVGAGEALGRIGAQWSPGDGPLELVVSGDLPPVGAIAVHPVAGKREAESVLSARLAQAQVGLRVYLCGPESFVRRATAIATEAGLLAGELRTEVCGTRARRVRCAHCRATTEGVTTTLVPCAGCQRTLEVYHHFSRRHAAYLGFKGVSGRLSGSRSA